MTSNKRAFILVLGMGLCFIPSSATAGANSMVVESPVLVHRFLDAKNISLQAFDVLIMAADVASTNRALQVPGTREMNPLSRSQGALISLKVAGVGAGIGIAYLMHQSGHHKAERMIPLIFGVPSALAAAHNAGIHR